MSTSGAIRVSSSLTVVSLIVFVHHRHDYLNVNALS